MKQVLILYTYVDVGNFRQLSSELLPKLSTRESAKILNTQRKGTAIASLTGKYLLQEGLKHFSIPETALRDLEYDPNKRPFIRFTDLDFNISHSNDLVVCALSTDTRLGLDIELVKPFKRQHLNAFFSADEQAFILGSPAPMQTFYELWTRKEAVLKADGRGLSLKRSKLEFYGSLAVIEQEVSWETQLLEIDPLYIAHIATSPSRHTKFQMNRIKVKCLQ